MPRHKKRLGRLARLKRLQHTNAFHHTHHVAYVLYYGFALIEDHGAKLIIVGIIFTFATIAALCGDSTQ